MEKILKGDEKSEEDWQFLAIYHGQCLNFLGQEHLGKLVVLIGSLVLTVLFWGQALDGGGWWWFLMMIAAGASVFFGYLVFWYQKKIIALQSQNEQLWQKVLEGGWRKKSSFWETVWGQIFWWLTKWVKERGLFSGEDKR
jgi:hypothetical protein